MRIGEGTGPFVPVPGTLPTIHLTLFHVGDYPYRYGEGGWLRLSRLVPGAKSEVPGRTVADHGTRTRTGTV